MPLYLPVDCSHRAECLLGHCRCRRRSRDPRETARATTVSTRPSTCRTEPRVLPCRQHFAGTWTYLEWVCQFHHRLDPGGSTSPPPWHSRPGSASRSTCVPAMLLPCPLTSVSSTICRRAPRDCKALVSRYRRPGTWRVLRSAVPSALLRRLDPVAVPRQPSETSATSAPTSWGRCS